MLNANKPYNGICVVDSDAIGAMLNKRLMQILDKDMAIAVCNDPDEAIAYLEQQPDNKRYLVLSELVFPGFSTEDTIGCYSKIAFKNVDFVILTASILEQDKHTVASVEFLSHYIEKPLTADKYNFLIDSPHFNVEDLMQTYTLRKAI